jgi:hypothetical protein
VETIVDKVKKKIEDAEEANRLEEQEREAIARVHHKHP